MFVLVVILAAIAMLAPAAEAKAASSCPPYEVIGARGSGQRELRSEQNMGPEVHDFYVSLRVLLGSGVVHGHGVRYPAVNVKSAAGAGAALHLGGAYTDSVRAGSLAVRGWIHDRHKACADTRFVLAGYSQGAQAMGDALAHSGVRKLVAAVALFGDPYFNADSWSARGSYDPSSYGVFGPRGEWDSSLYGHVFSYCHWHDIICNETVRHHVLGTNVDVYVRSLDDLGGRTAAHGTPAYRLEAYGGEGDAGQAAREAARALGFVPSPLPYTGPLDIAFVIDSTGSMSDEIDEVKENVTALAEQIAAVDPDYRLALVDYKDVEEEESAYQARLDLDFTTDVPSFDRELAALEADGGGDEPESVYSGLMTALNLAWRPGSKKIVVQIGDAPAKDPEPVTGYTLRAVQTKALSVDPATIDSIQSGEAQETADSFGAIASATGGQFLQLPESDLSGLVPAIVEEIRRNATAPAAALSAPSHAVAGQPVTFSAGASRDVGEAIAGYDWDFNGDGVFDASTEVPVATYTFPAPFTGTATVQVRSDSGLASLATAPIAVVAPLSKRPRKPNHMRKSVRGTRLKLTWTAGRGVAPQWFTVLGRRGHVLARIAVRGDAHLTSKGKRRRFSATVGGLRRHRRPYRFWVAAGSEAGESRRAGPVKVQIGQRRHRHRRHGR